MGVPAVDSQRIQDISVPRLASVGDLTVVDNDQLLIAHFPALRAIAGDIQVPWCRASLATNRNREPPGTFFVLSFLLLMLLVLVLLLLLLMFVVLVGLACSC